MKKLLHIDVEPFKPGSKIKGTLFKIKIGVQLHIDVEPFKLGPKIKGTLFKIGVQDCRAGNGL